MNRTPYHSEGRDTVSSASLIGPPQKKTVLFHVFLYILHVFDKPNVFSSAVDYLGCYFTGAVWCRYHRFVTFECLNDHDNDKRT
jgi:hypothetical protein